MKLQHQKKEFLYIFSIKKIRATRGNIRSKKIRFVKRGCLITMLKIQATSPKLYPNPNPINKIEI